MLRYVTGSPSQETISPSHHGKAFRVSIKRVINQLKPETAFEGRYAEPAALRERMAHFKTPGASIAVVHEGQVAWAQGFGVREWGRSEPVTEATLFQAGSVSKPIFALAVMRLWEAGDLDLDTDVNAYLRSWQVPRNGDWQPHVTLRQILSHTAGFTVHGFPGYPPSGDLPSAVHILQGTAPANTPPILVSIVPGVQSRYSGGGITVAQLAVTDLVGKPFPEIMREVVLQPLGMASSSFEQPPSEAMAGAAATAHPSNYQPVQGRWHVYPEMAAAGLWSTPRDLAVAGIEIQRALRGQSDFLSQRTVSEMLTPQTDQQNGLGLFLDGEKGTARFGHGGWDEGFVTSFTMYQSLGMGAVVMLNSNQGQPLLGEIERAIADVYEWPGYFPPHREAAHVDASALEPYMGTYMTSHGLRMIVAISGASLALSVGAQPFFGLQPISEGLYSAESVNATVSFDSDGDKETSGLTLTQSGRSTHAKRSAATETT
ncbi:MAG: class A beta-lactamase-related serine hydrolase [Chloroflexi bacterium]|nr:class A beta-lactamase-related serine hydrolase [Chloroflexota bacterium]